MTCPRLPDIPSSAPNRISPSWFQRLNDCLQYAMTHPRGDGATILNDAGGTLRALGGGGGSGGGGAATGSGNGRYSGPFAVSRGEEEREIIVTGGYTDRGTVGHITTLELPSSGAGTVVIYLTAGTLSPVISLASSMPTGLMYYTLADIPRNGNVVQRHFGDVYFGALYVIDALGE